MRNKNITFFSLLIVTLLTAGSNLIAQTVTVQNAASVRQALVDKAGSLAEAWAKNCILAERVESTFIPENADYARHRGDMDYVDVDALDPSFDLSDDEQYWAALEKANYPFMKFEEAAAHKKIEPPYGAEVRECAEQVYDAVLAAAMA